MKLTTDKGQTFDVDWAHAPAGPRGEMLLRLRDPRPLPMIAADLDGCGRFRRVSDNQGDAEYAGYTLLIALSRPDYPADPDAVLVTLARPAGPSGV